MNPTLSTRDITLELLAIQDHIRKKPTFESGNLLVVAGWHAVAELLYVSRYFCSCDMSDTECTAQCNILYWETASPRWELPEYVDTMALDVREAKDWISRSAIGTGSSTQGPGPKAASNGESEVDWSGGDREEVPPSPGLSGPKVHAQDLEDVVLDKGPWAATPGVHQGWRIFVGVSPSPYFISSVFADSPAQGHLAWCIPICQQCSKLGHACSGLADRVCGRCMRDHKVCQEVVVEGECLSSFLTSDSEVTPRTSPHSTFSRGPSRPPSPACDPREAGGKQGEGGSPTGRSSQGSQGDSGRDSPPSGGG